MKIKSDFTTNSSSASFILLIEFSSTSLSDFQDSWEKFLETYVNEHKYRIDKAVKKFNDNVKRYEKDMEKSIQKQKEGKTTELENWWIESYLKDKDKEKPNPIKEVLGQHDVEHVIGNLFSVTSHTSMFNYIIEDVPEWMIYLMVKHTMKDPELFELGFKDIRFKIEDDH